MVQGVTLSATGNVVGGNVNTAGLVSAAGNVTSTGNVSGGFILGNIAFTTGGAQSHVHANIQSGTSLVNIPAADGNVIANVGGSTIQTWASTGVYITGLASVTGNVISGNVTASGNINIAGARVATLDEAAALAIALG